MATSPNWLTKVLTIPQSDLTLVTGTLYALDTYAWWQEMKALEASEDGIVFPDITRHNTEVVVAGVTYARFIEVINGYTVEFQDGVYAAQLVASNNNLFDEGVIVRNQVSVVSNNSAGLTNPALSDAAKASLIADIFAHVVEGTESFAEQIRLIRAEAAGSIVVSGTLHEIKSADGGKNRIVANATETYRTVDTTDGT